MAQNCPTYRGSPFIETPFIEVPLYMELSSSVFNCFNGIHTIRDMIIDLMIDIIVLNLSYFMLCDDCKIATYVYILWVY